MVPRRRTGIRHLTIAGLSILVLYQAPITWVVTQIAEVEVREGILFTLNTLTSAGFGNVVIPKDDGFLLFAVVNLFISISMLAILVSSAFGESF